ncbi:Hexamerin [Habropoda laboriosa]|uniref:Hexamerin n=1 Tax=Habropoda laboriosa TaxID=597456 RepID=A0A0L7R5R4_9HYME|nr:Hexamerin [Habropoda laboriosa]
MRFVIVLLALVVLGTCSITKQRAADQELLKKQQDVIQLLQKISQPIPNQQLQNLGASYDIENNSHQYQNPIVVKYYAGAVKAGLVQPKGTVYSNSISQLRKEVSLLYRILLGAKNYQTFLKTAAWARVHVNEGQFIKALASAVLTRQDTQGLILPPAYEILPQNHLDSRIIQEAQDIAIQQGIQQRNIQGILIPVNYSALLSHDEQQLSYFTQDVGLASYYAYVNLASYILDEDQQQQQQQQQQEQQPQPQQPLNLQQYQQQTVGKYLQQVGQQGQQNTIGHGSQYLFLHQQLLAHYELNRLSNGLGPIQNIDYKSVQSLYQPHLRNLNGLEFPSRPENLQLQPQKNKLIQSVVRLEERLMEAIDSGHVVTPQGIFLSLYQPQGMNILGDLIEGSGRSVNPRYYGSLQAAARKLLGNAPEVQNIWDYTPSALELEQTAVHDPAFYQLYKRVMNLFQKYQQSLPAYQSNDLILPGVTIQNVDVSQLVTLFSNYYINLDTVTPQQDQSQEQQQQQQQEQVQQQVKAHLKRLDHKPFQYKIAVHSEQNVPNVVVRVFLGPKHDYEGKPVSISQNRHLFVQLDQSIQNLHPGQNIIIRNSQQAPGQSADWPSTQQIQQGVNNAIRSQGPFYIAEPHQIFSFPARLSLPKGTQQGFPLQFLVVISGPNALNVPCGPVIPEQALTYQEQQFQIVNPEQYHQLKQHSQLPQVSGGIQQNVEVLPENLVQAQQQVKAVRDYYANVYTRYHGQYPNTQIQNPVGEGQDMTYTIQGVGVINSGLWSPQPHGLAAQQQISRQQTQQAREIQEQIQAAAAAAAAQQEQVSQMIYGQRQQHQQAEQQRGQNINWKLPGAFQNVQAEQQGLQGVQGVQGVQQGLQDLQGLQGVQGGQQGIQAILKGVQGVWGLAQGVQGVKVPYGMQGSHIQGNWQEPEVQGGIEGGIVASGQQHAGGFQGIYAQLQTVQDQSVTEYYQNKPISEIIGGAISLDGKPFGFPLERPMTPGALSVPNIFVKEVLVFHEGQPTNDITQ